jgi:hypothetical protein
MIWSSASLSSRSAHIRHSTAPPSTYHVAQTSSDHAFMSPTILQPTSHCFNLHCVSLYDFGHDRLCSALFELNFRRLSTPLEARYRTHGRHYGHIQAGMMASYKVTTRFLSCSEITTIRQFCFALVPFPYVLSLVVVLYCSDPF